MLTGIGSEHVAVDCPSAPGTRLAAHEVLPNVTVPVGAVRDPGVVFTTVAVIRMFPLCAGSGPMAADIEVDAGVMEIV